MKKITKSELVQPQWQKLSHRKPLEPTYELMELKPLIEENKVSMKHLWTILKYSPKLIYISYLIARQLMFSKDTDKGTTQAGWVKIVSVILLLIFNVLGLDVPKDIEVGINSLLATGFLVGEYFHSKLTNKKDDKTTEN